METAMPLDAEEMIQLLLKTNKEQEQTITDLRATIKDLRITPAKVVRVRYMQETLVCAPSLLPAVKGLA